MSPWAEVLSRSRTVPLRETVRKYIPSKIKIDKPVRQVQLYFSHWPNFMGEILMTELKVTKSGVYCVSSVVKLNVSVTPYSIELSHKSRRYFLHFTNILMPTEAKTFYRVLGRAKTQNEVE